MCSLCSATRPTDPFASMTSHVTDRDAAAFGLNADPSGRPSGGLNSGVDAAAFTLTQIAAQLTDGYWNSTGQNWRAFDVNPGGTLTYDVSGLTAEGRFLAVSALQAWTDVTGIRFVAATTLTQVNEGSDASAGTGTTKSMQVNQNFNGSITAEGDVDWVRVRLVAGTTYTATLSGDGSANELGDPILELRGPGGALLNGNDDFNGRDSQLTINVGTTGYYYLAASSFPATSVPRSGAYDLSLTTGSSADILFDDDDTGAYSTSEVTGNTITSSFVNVTTGWDPDPQSINSYWFQTYVHEVGHALGLGHAGDYNGGAVWGVDNDYDNDSWQASIMSYFSQTDNPNTDADYAYLATVMPADIIAIQELYGPNVSTRPGNTIYGANTNVAGYLGSFLRQMLGQQIETNRYYLNNDAALTIYDTGGIDTLDFSTVNVAQVINLNATVASNVNGVIGNLLIAPGVVIENAIGGRGADRLRGNGIDNVLTGGLGNDTLNGGGGRDMVAYTGSANITLRLAVASPQSTGQGSDMFVSIESARTAAGNDRLYGSGVANVLVAGSGNDGLFGGLGNDSLRGDAGSDTLSGSSGTDTAFYVGSTAAQVNLGIAGAQTTGYGADVLTGIENLLSGSGNDRLTGSALANRLTAGAGHDRLYGGAGNDTLQGGTGDDVLAGGAGADTAAFLGSFAARINLGSDLVQATGDGSDRLYSIENALTGAGNDRIYGSTAANRISAGAGNDSLYGGVGADTLLGDAGFDTLSGGGGADAFYFSDGDDRIADFTNNVDEIHISNDLWGGGSRTVAQLLAFASVQAGSVVFSFGGGHQLTVQGLTQIAALADDIMQY